MKWFIVKYRVDPYPHQDQWMLTPAANREEAIVNIDDYMSKRGIFIREPVAEMDQSHYVRRVGRPIIRKAKKRRGTR